MKKLLLYSLATIICIGAAQSSQAASTTTTDTFIASFLNKHQPNNQLQIYSFLNQAEPNVDQILRSENGNKFFIQLFDNYVEVMSNRTQGDRDHLQKALTIFQKISQKDENLKQQIQNIFDMKGIQIAMRNPPHENPGADNDWDSDDSDGDEY